MAIVTFNICLALLLFLVESCVIPRDVHLVVPQTIPVGHEITKVPVADCDRETVRVTSNDPDFAVGVNGAVVVVNPVTLETGGRTFSILARDSGGARSEMVVHLDCNSQPRAQRSAGGLLRRVKRRWGPPPSHILENEKGPFPVVVDEIVSDSSAKHNVYYTMSGPGVNEPPLNLFTLNQTTGMLLVHGPIDREKNPQFILKISVFEVNTHKPTDIPVKKSVVIDDMNDNPPEFQGLLEFTVPEHSNVATVVGTVNATDKDEKLTLHVMIAYSLLTTNDLFAIQSKTGVITTRSSSLDREVKDKYTAVVQIKDMGGRDDGLFTTGTATITLSDINDNPPTFLKPSYEASVRENESDKLILKIPVEDKDLVNTPNWLSQFTITKGNETGNFRINTDPKTNEGLLYISKPLDFEKTPSVNLEIMARNVAELSGTRASWKTVPVTLNVIDVDEGPEFTAPTMYITVKENLPNGTSIGTYKAVDPETKSSNGISYYKTSDPGSWISVDKVTGELKVANTIDRESHLVHDGIYTINVKAVDATSKSGTGTVILSIEDVNDNVPTVNPSKLVMCRNEGELGSVLIVPEDLDLPPFSSPFTFNLAKNPDGIWSLKKYNDTAATLQLAKDTHDRIHVVALEIMDLQGKGEIQEVTVEICQCNNGECISKPWSASLGGLGVLALLLPLLLLLLLCLLLIFFCVTQKDKIEIDPTDSAGILITSNTEGPGEEVDSNLIHVPITTSFEQGVKGSVKGSVLNAGWQGNKSLSTFGNQEAHESGLFNTEILTSDANKYHSGQYSVGQLVGSGVGLDSRYLAQDSSFRHTWHTNGRYLQQKLGFFATEEDGRYADDIIHSYGFEGAGSVAGSVGCCSNLGDNDNLDFLNTIGPKFKNLAGVCTKR